MKLEWLTTAMLLLTTIFSYAHEQFGTAVVAGICAGFVGGMTATKAIVRSRSS